ncbi:967_t:CDS:1 [Paraglomus brasilianum]|uniref:967_t:CDS:1 n=1 Tax=Paraglomus brasilianum TaxID=144538 RepID=A0A9N9GWL6_9GLOM|nr:967_t:CDS:1 [Paraglomus brasilianum]
MDLSWCPACDRQFFVTNLLYCSEECRLKDALSTSLCPTLPHYGFSRCSSPKFAHSPLSSPSWSPLQNPPASLPCDPLKIDNHFQRDELSTSPEGLLLSRRNAIECSAHREATDVSFTLINASAAATATETTFTTITVETREIRPVGLASLPIRKKRSFIGSAWSMFFS